MQLEVLNIKGEKTGRKVELADEIFGVEPNDHVNYLDVKRYLINQRQGTHKAKERNEVHGSTRKLHKQKGTGGSRKGGINNPLFRGGGRIFGPKPRTYDIKLNKKTKQAARISALAYKAKNNEIFVLENFSIETPKTKTYKEILSALNISDKKSLLVLNAKNDNILLSARNLQNASVTTSGELNTYALMHTNALLLSEEALTTLNETLK
jgi:large subunit ribosomal protein L4